MSRRALPNFRAFQTQQGIRSLFFSWPGLKRPILLFVISIFFSLWIASGNVTAEMLFQSPPPTEQAPTEQPPAEQPTFESQPSEYPTAEPEDQPFAPAESTPQPIKMERASPDEISLDEEGEENSPNFILDQIELIDTIVVSSAYVWLCCGVLLFLLVPILLLFLYVRGRSKITREQDF